MKTKSEVLAELLDMHRSLCETKALYLFTSASQIVISAQLSTLAYAIKLVRQLPDAESWQDAPDEDGWYFVEGMNGPRCVYVSDGGWWVSACPTQELAGRRVRKVRTPKQPQGVGHEVNDD